MEAAGFQVVPGGRANYHASDFSLAAVLNMRYHDDLAAAMEGPSIDRTPVRERLARHEVGEFLRSQGYRYYHLGAWWNPTRSSPIADEVLALGKTTEFDTVLRETTLLPALERLAGVAPEDTHSRSQHRDQALFAFRQLQRLADTPGRKFVFAHILMPHTPYVLAEGGRYVLEAEAKQKSEAELFEQQLEFTNEKVNEIVAKLLEGPDDEDPIIIITGDEGPYLCDEIDCVDGSPEVYGIRLGTLRAYYLPGLDYQVPADDSGVNIFRMILREYFGADLPDLPNRSYDWPDRRRTCTPSRTSPTSCRCRSSRPAQRWVSERRQPPGADPHEHEGVGRQHRQLRHDLGHGRLVEDEVAEGVDGPVVRRQPGDGGDRLGEQLARDHRTAEGPQDHARHHADGAGLVWIGREHAHHHGRTGPHQREEHHDHRGAEQVAPAHPEQQR